MNIHAHRTDAAQPVESFRLANGLDVVVVNDRRAPVVTHMAVSYTHLDVYKRQALLASVIETCRRRKASAWRYLGTVIAAARKGSPLPALPAIPAAA